MPRSHQEWMDSLLPERRSAIDAETARLLADLDQREAERKMVLETARMFHSARKAGVIASLKVKPSWAVGEVVISRTLDVLKLRRPRPV